MGKITLHCILCMRKYILDTLYLGYILVLCLQLPCLAELFLSSVKTKAVFVKISRGPWWALPTLYQFCLQNSIAWVGNKAVSGTIGSKLALFHKMFRCWNMPCICYWLCRKKRFIQTWLITPLSFLRVQSNLYLLKYNQPSDLKNQSKWS